MRLGNRLRPRTAAVALAALAWLRADAADTWRMMNPTGMNYSNELVRIKVDVPEDVASAPYVVKEDGKEIPYQVEDIAGKKHVWVVTDLQKGRTHTYRLEPGKPSRLKPRVKVRKWWGAFTMDNGLVALKVPAEAKELVGPVRQVRLPNGKWAGKSFWKTDRKLKAFTSELIGDGTVFAKVRVRYDFEGKGGLFNETPAFYQADITLAPGRRHAVIEESYAMGRGDYWEFDAAHGRSGCGPLMRGLHPIHAPNFRGTLEIGQTRMQDTLINLIPRWSQAFDDDPYFVATNAATAVGAIACRAGKWLWPYNGMIEVKVKESADYAGLRCPTWRGKRYWYLLAGPRSTWPDYKALESYTMRHAVHGLDKLHQEYILDWPGLKPPEDKELTPEQIASWGGGAGRFSMRHRPFAGWGPSSARWGGEGHPIGTLTRVQNMFDPDTYGTHWLYYSPENPNFFSHWVNRMFAGLQRLKEHPQFEAIRRLAEQKALEESYFGVTLPGGAGQECFGYMARGSWSNRLKNCEELGCRHVDVLRRRNEAANAYIFKTSHPMPDGTRRMHPGGDTHPPGGDPCVMARAFGLPTDATALRTEEFPGFGAVLRNRAGTPYETYFSFKSGPNRGHFHGDQLAFHYCAYGRPLAVDHHCSYGPRAGQEHMHNRVAFHTDELPWANMDGYERLIAFKTSGAADVAMGQVESERLRITEKFPPEKWDCSLPQTPLDPNLTYRRTVVMLRERGQGAGVRGQDCFVIRDQYGGPSVNATYCLHVLGERCERDGNRFAFDGLDLHVVAPKAFSVSRHDWTHHNGGKEATRGLRLTVSNKREGEFITVLVPRPVLQGDVLECTIKKAFMIKYTPRGRRNVRKDEEVDFRFLVPWKDGRPVPGPAYVSSYLDRQKKQMFQTHETTVDVAEDGSVRIRSGTVFGNARRNQRRRMSLEYTLRFKTEGAAVEGAWSGRWHDNKAAGAGQPGAEREEGVDRLGTLSGTLRKNVPLPLPRFDDQWKGPRVEAIPGGVRVGDDAVVFGGGIDDAPGTTYVSVRRGEKGVLTVTDADVDLNRSQGDIGIFIPDAGYPFGVIPEWLLRQRTKVPDWYEESWPPTRDR